jgi:hypothetical protein
MRPLDFQQRFQDGLAIGKRNGTRERPMGGSSERGLRRRGFVFQHKRAEQGGEMGGMDLESGHDTAENMLGDGLFHGRRLPC